MQILCLFLNGYTYLANAILPLSSSLIAPTSQSIASHLVAPNQAGLIMGVMQSVGSISRIIGPIGAAILFARISPHAPYFVAAAIVAFGLVIIYLERKLPNR